MPQFASQGAAPTARYITAPGLHGEGAGPDPLGRYLSAPGLPSDASAAATVQPGAGGFGASPLSGMDQFNAFAGGPLQDAAEGIAMLLTKNNDYRQMLQQRMAARRRQQAGQAMDQYKFLLEGIQKDPRFAQLLAPGGAMDGVLDTQKILAKRLVGQAGGDTGLVDQADAFVRAAIQQGPEALPPTPQMQNAAAVVAMGGTQAQAMEPLGVSPQKPQEPKYFSAEVGVDGFYHIPFVDPSTGQSGDIKTSFKAPAGAGTGTQLRILVGPNGELMNAGSDSGNTGPAAGGRPISADTYANLQDTKERIAQYDNAISVVDGLVELAGKPGSQLGVVGGIKAVGTEAARIAGEAGSVVTPNVITESVRKLADVGQGILENDTAHGLVDPQVTLSINTDEDRIAYAYARALQGPNGKILMDAVNAARKSSNVMSMFRSEKTTVENLLKMRKAIVMAKHGLQKGAAFNETPNPEPNLGEYGQQQPAAGAAVEAPTEIQNDAEYNKLAPGTLFKGPDGKVRRKP